MGNTTSNGEEAAAAPGKAGERGEGPEGNSAAAAGTATATDAGAAATGSVISIGSLEEARFVPLSAATRAMTMPHMQLRDASQGSQQQQQQQQQHQQQQQQQHQHQQPRGIDFEEFMPLTKRAMTFVDSRGPTAEREVRRVPAFALDDVLFRRHFNTALHSPLKRVLSLRGVSATSVQEREAEEAQRKTQHADECVVVVDPFSTGALLAHYADSLYGYPVVSVHSADAGDLEDMVPPGLELNFTATLQFDDKNTNAAEALQQLVDALNTKVGKTVAAVLAGSETGVELADALSEALNLRSNGSALSEARRNKYVMGETIRAAGVRAVQQKLARTWQEIDEFLSEWQPDPFRVVVKPMQSAGSDDVTLCHSVEDVRDAFGRILGKTNGLGQVNEGVLVQEYLEGTEYVVDSVSLDGEHKIITLWEYDRRPLNDASFVLFGQKILDQTDPRAGPLMDYTRHVLDALGIRNGPAHAEVKWCRDEPVLVEIGARCHGGEGAWARIVDEALGYNQVRCVLDAYLAPDAFAKVPARPVALRKQGRLKFLLNHTEGQLVEYDVTQLQQLQELDSYVEHFLFKDPGCFLQKTVDCFSWVGCVGLTNVNGDAVERDYAWIEHAERDALYCLDASAAPAPPERAVVVIDPFSTGACVAAEVCAAGRQCICVYSDELERMQSLASLVPEGLELHFAAVIGQRAQGKTDNSAVSEEDHIAQCVEHTVVQLRALPFEVEAVLAGSETGVELADALSETLNLRSNGSALSEARRNKYVMGETIRAAGVRAVQQKLARTWQEIDEFLSEWQPDPFRVVVKPMQSAGSDDVTLCHSVEDVRDAFGRILGKTNGLGQVNEGVLVQEYLEGTEYVVDSVSLDGEHKIVAIWQYHRECANGAQFLLAGQHLLDHKDPRADPLMDYTRRVLDALGIRNGPAHGEVKWCRNEPVLVEIGARCHGSEGVWMQICDSVYGYSQVSATVDAYVRPESFAALPAAPGEQRCCGRLLFLVSYVEGVFDRLEPSLADEILAMESFVGMELFVRQGQPIVLSRDCFTLAGVVKFRHEDSTVVDTDYERVFWMQSNGLFVLSN